jgi:hypothetical protein
MDSLWILYGFFMDSLWILYGFFMDSLAGRKSFGVVAKRIDTINHFLCCLFVRAVGIGRCCWCLTCANLVL